jgi:hypothetical protein
MEETADIAVPSLSCLSNADLGAAFAGFFLALTKAIPGDDRLSVLRSVVAELQDLGDVAEGESYGEVLSHTADILMRFAGALH